MRKFLMICMFVTLAVITASAQMRIERRPCVRTPKALGTRLVDLKTDWDPSRTYRQVVILVSYKDQDFSMEDPKTYYDRLFNAKGYNEREAHGCVADYFRDQSNGMFNLQFDVFGPIRVERNVKRGYMNYGEVAFQDAVQKAIDSLKVDFSPYDWDDDGEVDQVVFVSAGYCANGSNSSLTGYLWPNTDYLNIRIKTLEGKYIWCYSCSAEKWYNGIPCGLGTICHEYSHCLGLPDLYPTDNSSFSVVDEWDLMDGGNYTCWGWSPPNYSASQKIQLGWLSPEEITGPLKVKDLKPVAEGGRCYRSTIIGDEYYLVENRQQTGWDRGLPGKGLLITYNNFNSYIWRSNSVNSRSGFNYDIVHADGMSYTDWENYVEAAGLAEYDDVANRYRRRLLSTAAYPLKNDSVDVHECQLLPYAFTNITMDADGTVSFEIVKGEASGVRSVECGAWSEDVWYDLQGRRLPDKPARKGLYIHNGKKECIR